MSKIREIYRMDRALRLRSPSRHRSVRSAHAKTFAHLDRRGGAMGSMPKSPSMARKVEALHAALARQSNPGRGTKGVTISQTLGRLMLDYVNEHDPEVTAFETIAAEAASHEHGTRVPLKLAVAARAEIQKLLELQTDPLAIEELEGFADNFDFAIEKARRKNPSSAKGLVKKVRASKAKKAARKSAAVRGAAGDARKARVRSVLKTLEKNPGKSQLGLYISMIPSLDDDELKRERAAVRRRMKAVEERDRGASKGLRLRQLERMGKALEKEHKSRREPNPKSVVRRKGRYHKVYAFDDHELALVEKYKLEKEIDHLDPDQIEALMARIKLEEIEAKSSKAKGAGARAQRKAMQDRAKFMRARRQAALAGTKVEGRMPKMPPARFSPSTKAAKKKAAKKRRGHQRVELPIADDGEVFELPPRKQKSLPPSPEEFESAKTGKFDKLRESNPLKRVQERFKPETIKKIVRENTEREIAAGRTPEQAYAIAINSARKQAPKKMRKLYPERNPSARGIEFVDLSNKKHYVIRVPISGKAKIVAGPFKQPKRAIAYIEKKTSQELYDVSTGEIIPIDAKGGALLDVPMNADEVREMKSGGMTWEEFFEDVPLGAAAREHSGARPNPRGRKKKSKKKGRRRWGSGARAAAGGAVGGLALGLPGAAAGAYVGATRELRKRKGNPYRGEGQVEQLRSLAMDHIHATRRLDYLWKKGSVPDIHRAIADVIARRAKLERFVEGEWTYPDVSEGIDRRALDARMEKEARKLPDDEYEALLRDVQKLRFQKKRAFRDPKERLGLYKKRRGLFGRRRRNPKEADRFEHHGEPADLDPKKKGYDWGEYEAEREMYRGKIPPDPRKKNPRLRMTHKDLAKLLKKLGFEKIRQKGSHEIYLSPTGQTISLPKKKKASEIMSPHYEKQIYAAAQNPASFGLGHALVLNNIALKRSECIASILHVQLRLYSDLEKAGLIKISRVDGPNLTIQEDGEPLMLYTVCASITEKGRRFAKKSDAMRDFKRSMEPMLKKMSKDNKGSRNKNPSKKPGARELVTECRRLWEHYCERPNKTRLKAVLKHCEKMAESTAKSVKEERARCMRSARSEMKKLGMK